MLEDEQTSVQFYHRVNLKDFNCFILLKSRYKEGGGRLPHSLAAKTYPRIWGPRISTFFFPNIHLDNIEYFSLGEDKTISRPNLASRTD